MVTQNVPILTFEILMTGYVPAYVQTTHKADERSAVTSGANVFNVHPQN